MIEARSLFVNLNFCGHGSWDEQLFELFLEATDQKLNDELNNLMKKQMLFKCFIALFLSVNSGRV